MEIKNFELIEKAQEKCKINLMTKRYLQSVLEEYKERIGLPHKKMQGIHLTVKVCGRQKYSKWSEQCTFCCVKHTGKEWDVVEAGRTYLHESPRIKVYGIGTEAIEAIKEKAVERAMRMA